MSDSNLTAQTLVDTFVSEANSAADMVFLEINEMEVPDEVIEAIRETKELANKATNCDDYSNSVLSDYNWTMHIICAKLYLNIQRIPRIKRECLSDAISAYKNMMYHFSMGQLQIMPIAPEQFLHDMGYHAKILNEIAQKEITRLISICLINQEYADISIEIDNITSCLVKCLAQDNLIITALQDMKSIPVSFSIFTDKLRCIAEALGELGDPLSYLAKEYTFFSTKIKEMLNS